MSASKKAPRKNAKHHNAPSDRDDRRRVMIGEGEAGSRDDVLLAGGHS